MITNNFITYSLLLTCLSPIMCASLERNWSNNFLAARRTTSMSSASALVDDEDIDDWQPAVRPQNWLITTSATVPLSLTSSRLGERERISLMFERQQEQHQHFLPNHFYGYSHHSGNYTKRQTASLATSPTPVTTTSKQPAVSAENLRLKPYVVATSRNSNNNINSNTNYNANLMKVNMNANVNYRHLNPRKHYTLSADPYARISKEPTSSVVSQSERRMDTYTNLRPNIKRQSQHTSYHENTITPDESENHVSHMPALASAKRDISSSSKSASASFDVTNVNTKKSQPQITTTSSSNKIDDENINEILLPLHAALDTVKEFCDFIKDLITDEKDNTGKGKVDQDHDQYNGNGNSSDNESEADTDVENDDEDDFDVDTDDDGDDKDLSNEAETNSTNDADSINLSPILMAVKAFIMQQPQTDIPSYTMPGPAISKVQGYMDNHNKVDPSATTLRSLASTSNLPQSDTSQQSLDVGTGRARRLRRRKVRLPHIFGHHGRVKRRKAKRRIRRKFKKYIFPLLIAYKLLFLALIPLLVGGLTLLVGSTGMAGFFFALFAAVMTIRRRAGGGDGGGGDGRSATLSYY